MRRAYRIAALLLAGGMLMSSTACEEWLYEEGFSLPDAEEQTEAPLSPEEIAGKFEDFTLPPSIRHETPPPADELNDPGDDAAYDPLYDPGYDLGLSDPAYPGYDPTLYDPAGETLPPTERPAEPAVSTPPAETAVPETAPVVRRDGMLAGRVFLGRSEAGERYLLFPEEAAGTCADQETGEVQAFTYTQDGRRASFRFGEEALDAELTWADGNTVIVLWSSGRSETLTDLRQRPADFTFYSSAQLRALAADYFAEKHGYRPACVESMPDAGGLLLIHLYDLVDGHTATCDWFTIDPFTGRGKDLLDKAVVLGEAPTDEP